MNVYLISGKAGSGKNYIANKLYEQLNNSIVTSFSKYIKLFATELKLWDGNDNEKPREFLQNTGDIMRAIDDNFLTKRMLEDIKVYKKLGIENVIINDVRLKNEIEYMKSSSHKIITIRVNNKKSNRKLSPLEKKHLTETELDNYKKFDYIIENQDKNIEDIINKIVKGNE